MKKLLSLILIGVLVLSISIPSSVNAIDTGQTHGEALFELGIISGSGGSIKEGELITREEMVTILSRLLEGEIDFVPPSIPSFKDVPTSHWAYKDIELALSKGITSGVGNGNFGLTQKVNNNQASLFLLKNLGYDTSDIDYNKASSIIADKYNLSLEAVEPGSKQLIRGQIFELLAKTLNMPTKDNPDTKKISLLKYDADKIKNFEKSMKNVIPYKVEKKEVQTSGKVGDFPVKDPIEVNKQTYMNYLKANPERNNIYEEMEKETKEMQTFINKYLSGKYVKLKITDDLIEKINTLNPRFASTEIDSYEEDFYEIWSSVSLKLLRDDVDKNKVFMDTYADSTEGFGGSSGYVTEIREYKQDNGYKVYAVLGKEEKYDYSNDGPASMKYVDFYFAFSVDSKGKLLETIGYAIYGQGHSLNE